MMQTEKDFDTYRRHVGDQCQLIAHTLGRIAQGETPAPLSQTASVPYDEFGLVFRDLDCMIDELSRARNDLENQNRENEFRTNIWRLSNERHLDDTEFHRKLMELIVGHFSIKTGLFFVHDSEGNRFSNSTAWPDTAHDYSLDAQIYEVLRISPILVHTACAPSLPDAALIAPLMQDGLGSVCIARYPATYRVKGFFLFADTDAGAFTVDKINLLHEVIRIVKSRTAQIQAESALKRLAIQLEEALGQSEGLYRTLVEMSPDAIMLLDGSRTFKMINQPALDLFRAPSRQTLLSQKIDECISPNESDRFVRYLRLVSAQGMVRATDMTFTRCDGSEFRGELGLSMIMQESGDAKFWIAVVRDVTERFRAQQELWNEKELLDVTLKSCAEGILVFDLHGLVTLMNPSAAKLSGWNPGDAAGRSLDDVLRLVNPDTRNFCPNPVSEVVRCNDAVIFNQDSLLIAKDGSERVIALSGSPIRGETGEISGVVLVFRDVTDKQKLEGELFKARKLESIGLLAGGIAHDFNNVLTGIVTNLFMAKMNNGISDEVRQFIGEAEKAAFRASRLTKQLLTFSKGGAPVKEQTSLVSIIEDAVGFSLSGSNVDYKLALDDNLWTVEVDRGQIDQVLNNLVINADQAMPGGGIITVTAHNRVIASVDGLPLAPGNYVEVSIADQGIGIPPDDLERIFDPYFTTKQNGSGLGLTTTFSIMGKHGGHISARSQLGKGATFTLYLPACVVEAPEGITAAGSSALTRLPADSRVLIMDDDDVVRLVVTRLLEHHGFIVDSASHGQEAVDKYRTALEAGAAYDVVVMDLTIPGGMGGKEAVRKVLDIDPTAQVIVFSGYSNDPVMANFSEYGFCGMIAKPFSIDEFLQVMAKILSPEV